LIRYPQPSGGGDAMNWDAVGAIGQVVGALALVFVLMQVRYARADMRRSVLDSMANAFIATVPISCDERVLCAMIKAEAKLGGEHAPEAREGRLEPIRSRIHRQSTG